jgi:polyisoprenoid-binding protein YceI
MNAGHWMLLGLCLASCAVPAHAQQLEASQSDIGFTVRQFGVPVAGRFTKFAGEIQFDPARPQAGKIALTIETGSARFGAAETDAEVLKPAWFDAGRFPQARLESTAIRALGPARYEVAARLRIKGVTRDVVVPVEISRSGALTIATGTVPIKRLEFNVGDGEWSDVSVVANEVQVKFRLALSGIASH